MDLGLKGKVALVTGAGSKRGFGRGIVAVLAKEGCDIIACDIDIKGAEEAADEIKNAGGRAIAVKTDITNSGQVKDAIKRAMDEFGRIDILVNNAGSTQPPCPFAASTEEKWARDIEINLIGITHFTRAVLPQMSERKNGKIINIASYGAIIGVPGGSAYSSAKAGVITFTKALAQEVADLDISVNCIAPQVGDTAFYDDFPKEVIENFVKSASEAGKSTSPVDVGNTVAFLASDLSRRIMGQCIIL
ncbi:MAG: SDR family oxidoreductase [Deltaproteobacteria bacterium]|nr:SDR family oxidoreductase [Deltaproteobacteria bacterium]